MSNDAYTELLSNLLPPGPAWTRQRGTREAVDYWRTVRGTPKDALGRPAGWSELQLFLDGLAAEKAALDQRLRDLILEANPLTAQETLAAKYREAGLPNPCAGPATTPQQQRREILFQWTALGGATAAYIEEVAARMGEQAAVTEYRPFRVDESTVETPVYGVSWAYAFRVTLVDPSLHYFTAGTDTSGVPLLRWDQTNPLLCFLNQIKPAHTVATITIVETADDLP